jgi:hypothetical protein
VALNKCEVGFGSLLPIFLKRQLGFFGPRKNQDTRRITIETVHDKDSLTRLIVSLLNIVIQRRVRSAPAITPSSNREKPGSFIHHDYVTILMNNIEPHRLVLTFAPFLFLSSHAAACSNLLKWKSERWYNKA